MQTELVLLGDSIFDNARYVAHGQSVTHHLDAELGTSAKVTLLACDGNRTADTRDSIAAIPRTATHIIISSGGNDALSASPTLDDKARTVREALAKLAAIIDPFADTYRLLLRDVAVLERPVAVCTIYDHIPGLKPEERLALSLYNDAIARAAGEFGATVIELRDIFTESSDYSSVSPIEPSSEGGRKLASAVASWLRWLPVGGIKVSDAAITKDE
jgi:hypothetical protein